MRALRRRTTTEPGWPEYLADRARTARDPRLARFFAAGTADPTTPIRDVPLVAVDMETTGLDPTRHGIVSIGLVPFTLERVPLAARRYWVVRPRQPLTGESVAFHHITHSDLEHAPDLDEVLDDVLAVLTGRVAVVHYRAIEREFLDATVTDRLGEGLRFPVIDTMELEARLHRASAAARLRRLVGQRPVSLRLGDTRARYGLPPYQGHHALMDALATAELLQAQVATHHEPATAVGDLWC
jgi:DNA polymerase-3 subunit epsilon